MATPTALLTLLLLLLPFTAFLSSTSAADSVLTTSGGGLDFPIAMSVYGGDDGEFEESEDDEEDGGKRRELYWRRWPQQHYYISYGALSANRVPCPPRSGRSYYTQNCFKARTPVNPYTRGCSRITRCRS
ncbi:Protein RALF-like 34 [Linum grandiflorum]